MRWKLDSEGSNKEEEEEETKLPIDFKFKFSLELSPLSLWIWNEQHYCNFYLNLPMDMKICLMAWAPATSLLSNSGQGHPRYAISAACPKTDMTPSTQFHLQISPMCYTGEFWFKCSRIEVSEPRKRFYWFLLSFSFGARVDQQMTSQNWLAIV